VPLPGPPVRVVYRKYDGSLHWHMELGRLGRDEYGTWLGAPPGSQCQRGAEEPVIFEQAYVLLIPDGSWWTMSCNAELAWTELYIDITTVPRWLADDLVETVDLDLDVIRRWDGSSEILDEDEFAEHQIRYGYPPDVIARAERTAAEMLDAVAQYAEPFGLVGRRWLAAMPGQRPGPPQVSPSSSAAD
jgi:uncharacterized protein